MLEVFGGLTRLVEMARRTILLVLCDWMRETSLSCPCSVLILHCDCLQLSPFVAKGRIAPSANYGILEIAILISTISEELSWPHSKLRCLSLIDTR